MSKEIIMNKDKLFHLLVLATQDLERHVPLFTQQLSLFPLIYICLLKHYRTLVGSVNQIPWINEETCWERFKNWNIKRRLLLYPRKREYKKYNKIQTSFKRNY